MGLLYDIIKRHGCYEVYIENEYFGFTDNFRDAAMVVEEYFDTNEKEVLIYD